MSVEHLPLQYQRPDGEWVWSGETEDDRIWSEFRAHAGDDHIIDAISDPTVLPQFRKRALEYSLSDDKWQYINKHSLSSSISRLEEGSVLSITTARIVKEKINSISTNSKRDYTEQSNLEDWNSLLIDVLPSLPEIEAEKLCEAFLIDKGREYDSRFSGLEDLFRNKKINERWKVKAAEKTHDRIVREKGKKKQVNSYRGWNGHLQTREIPSALERYRETMNVFITFEKDNPPVSQEFVQREIEFMMNHAPGERIIDSSYRINRLGKIFDDTEFVHRLLRNEILNDNKNGYWRIEVEDELIELCSLFPDDQELMEQVIKLKKEQDAAEEAFRLRQEESNREKLTAFAKIRKPLNNL